MNMTVIISQMTILFIVLAVGYLANKLKILNGDSNKLLSKLVINITLPCTILSSVMSGQVNVTTAQALNFTLLSAVLYALFFLIASPFPALIKAPKKDAGLFRYLIIFGNVGFMGFPIIQSIFGWSAFFYAVILNIIFNLLAYSAGLLMLTGKGGKLDLKLFLNPPLLSSVLAFVLFILRVQTPGMIADTAMLIGRMTTPAAMLIIGSTLASIPFREVFNNWRLYFLTVFKLVLVPLVIWLILKNFVSDQMALGVLVILAAMPSGTTAAMLCMEYNGNENLASKGIFITTLFPVFSIPALVFLLFS